MHVLDRARRLRESINAAEGEFRAEHSRIALFDTLTADANHLAKALRLPGVDQELAAALPDDLEERIRRTRNIWEHWEDENGPSMRWFRANYPGEVAWSVDDFGGEIRISGVYTLGELRDLLERVKAAVIELAEPRSAA